jgi:hypothetical protein
MKKQLIIAIAFVAITAGSFAQSNKEDVDLMQAAIGKDKKTLFTEFMILEDGAKKDAFWKLYDEYEGKRKEFGKKRLDLLEKYVKGYETMSEADTEQSLNDIIKMADDNNRLIVTYTNKMKTAAGVKAAAQFYQLENYILSVVRATLLANIPVLGGKK